MYPAASRARYIPATPMTKTMNTPVICLGESVIELSEGTGLGASDARKPSARSVSVRNAGYHAGRDRHSSPSTRRTALHGGGALALRGRGAGWAARARGASDRACNDGLAGPLVGVGRVPRPRRAGNRPHPRAPAYGGNPRAVLGERERRGRRDVPIRPGGRRGLPAPHGGRPPRPPRQGKPRPGERRAAAAP